MARSLHETSSMLRALTVRTYSAVILGIPFIGAVYSGFPAFDAVVAVGAAILIWEWWRLCAGGRFRLSGALSGMTVVTAIAATALAPIGVALVVLAAGAGLVCALSQCNSWLTAGTAYIGLPCLSLVWLRNDPVAGRDTVIWMLAVVWASDIGAYASGRLIGGPKLAPGISPNKTWAGLLGGILFAGAVGEAMASTLGHRAVWPLVLISSGLAVVGQAGDLAESWVKRRFGVKDASALIPGHGGLLDRVDSLMAVTLVTALITVFGKGSILTWL